MKKKIIALIVITLFFSGVFPKISGSQFIDEEESEVSLTDTYDLQEDVLVTCYTFGMPGEPLKEIEILQWEAEDLYGKIKELNFAVASNPLSERTQQLQNEIIDLADEYNLLPTGLSKNQVKEQYLQVYKPQVNRLGFLPQTQTKASEFLCTFVSTGSGGVLPIIALPRLIPILMIPIPRLFMIWRAQEAVTSCGGLRSGTGFIAYGQQNGIALGFWGLGFTFSLPPLMGVYGLAGYSLYASVNAEYIEFYPPNSPPVISQIDPGDGEINVPLSLSELRFQISDLNGELMSYTVTTTPDIGSGSGNLKPDGVYSVPISGLEDLTDYSWHIEVTDGKDTTINDFSFTTEAVAPIVSDPFPIDGSRHTSMDLPHLSFHLKDFQGDLMDYTVETVPDIGSASENGVEDGTYYVPIENLDFDTEYTWYVNVTDGTHWMKKVYEFKTRKEPGYWWDESWEYRKYLGVMAASSDYQLVLKIWKEDGHDSPENGNIDCEDHCNEDFSDIRFVTFDGVECKYWIEETGIGGGDHYAIVWVKLPSSYNEEIYLYYGNLDASDLSNGEDTFIFFDDFEGDDYNHDVWDTTGSEHTWTVSDSILTMESTGDPGPEGGTIRVKENAQIDISPYGCMAFSKLLCKRDPNPWETGPRMLLAERDEDPSINHIWIDYRYANDDDLRAHWVLDNDESSSKITNDGWPDDDWVYFITRSDPAASYTEYEALDSERNPWGDIISTDSSYTTDFSPIDLYFMQRPYSSGYYTKIDWLFISKYTTPPPCWESFGTEESFP